MTARRERHYDGAMHTTDTNTPPTHLDLDLDTPTDPPMRLALDLDGVVYNFDQHLRALYQHHHWEQPHAADLPEQARAYLDTLHDTHYPTMGDLLNWYTETQGWYNQPLLPDAALGVHALMRTPGLTMRALTARPQHAHKQTRHALARLFPGLDYTITTRPKYTYAHAYDLYIDDSPTELQHYHDQGLAYIVFDQPWNQEIPGPRAKDWQHLYLMVRAATRRWHSHDARPSMVMPSTPT